MIKSKKQMFIVIGLFTLLLFLGGTTYAWFTYRRETGEQELIAGEIYLHLNDGQYEIEMSNVFPETAAEARARNDNYITFSIDGKNTSNKTIYYEFILDHGETKASPKSRYRDEDLRFDLVEIDTNGDEVNRLLSNVGYDTLINKRIWVDTVDASTTSELVRRYKLRMWLSEDVVISDTADNRTYTTTEYPNKYATIKLIVNGDFTEKSLPAFYMLKSNANTTAQINFGNHSNLNNGQGLYRLKGTENDDYPIYYYRGTINNNNVIFGGFCWLMVRTTDTGGIKMIYNGVATSDGTTCQSSTKVIDSAPFYLRSNNLPNVGYNNLLTVGYMSNKEYGIGEEIPAANIYYGTSVEYGDFDNNGTNEYRLVSPSQTIDDNHKYSCVSTNANATCATARGYFYYSNYYYKYVELSGGETIDDVLYKTTGTGTNEVKARAINQNYVLNSTNSNVKTIIDDWFETNLTNEIDATHQDYREYLEDTVFCNDRHYKKNGEENYQNSGWYTNGGNIANFLRFAPEDRYRSFSTTNVPSFTCENITDQFSLSNSLAKLDYPVALLTSDEAILAGAAGNSTAGNYSYLSSGEEYWTMTPYNITSSSSMMTVGDQSEVTSEIIGSSKGIRPVLSLKLGVEFEQNGDGTATNPYIVKYN